MRSNKKYYWILIGSLFISAIALSSTFIKGPALIEDVTVITAAAGTTTLTNASQTNEFVNGATTQSVKLPDASTIPTGRRFYISNRSTGTVTVQYNDSTTAASILSGQQKVFVLQSNGSTNGTWDISRILVDLSNDVTGTLARNKIATGTAYRIVANDSGGALSENAAITASRAVASDVNGQLVASATTAAELAFVNGVTSAIQTQLNAKVASTRAINTTAPLTGGGDLSADRTIAIPVATSIANGYLSSIDWSTFNGKQAAGNYITALTGDATASGPGSAALTLATVNGNVGSFGSSTAIPNFTVNAKGLLTAAGTNVVIAPAGTLTGTTLASNVVSSSLTSLGTIATGVWNGTTIAIANGGTGQTSAGAAFNALAPATAKGGIPAGTGANTYGNLPVGADGKVLSADSAQATGLSWVTAGTGTVTSVAQTVPAGMAVSGSPVTTTGTLAITGFPNVAYVAKTGNYTLTTTDYSVSYDTSGGIATLTLPTAVGVTGQVYKIKLVTAGNILTIATTSSQTIDGLTTYKMGTAGDSLEVHSNGANWIVDVFNIQAGISYYGIPTGSVNSSFNIATLPTKSVDPLSLYSGGLFTAKYPGSYSICAAIALNGTFVSNSTLTSFAIFINGGQAITTANIATATNGTSDRVCVNNYGVAAGSTIAIETQTAGASPTFNGNADRSWFTITRTGN